MQAVQWLWETIPRPDTLPAREEMHLWCASLDLPEPHLGNLAATLSSDERDRAARFRLPVHRDRYLAGRGILRAILGSYLEIDPASLSFGYGPHGKPFLVESPGDVRFNASHSGDVALYAVVRAAEVGIDVERLRLVAETEYIAERFFSPREHAILAALPPEGRLRAFLHAWTRKEAYLKAIGKGLQIPLSAVEVSLGPGEPARILSLGGDTGSAGRWFLQDLAPAADHVAALAVEGAGWRVRCGQWPIGDLAPGTGALRE
ncbi:MAG: 4'-phosphopantetheinyl transferase superfamily protein [Gemmataceae bacterium]|nr:4'-phosphopantetheinyl transferase superfamily protein [Gemmataceae bacterium]